MRAITHVITVMRCRFTYIKSPGVQYVPSRSIPPPWGINPISSGSPHVRPMGRTCGEPDEIKKNTHPKYFTALFRAAASFTNHSSLMVVWYAVEAVISCALMSYLRAVQFHPHGGAIRFPLDPRP